MSDDNYSIRITSASPLDGEPFVRMYFGVGVALKDHWFLIDTQLGLDSEAIFIFEQKLDTASTALVIKVDMTTGQPFEDMPPTLYPDTIKSILRSLREYRQAYLKEYLPVLRLL